MAILLALSKAIEARDPYALGHAARVTEVAEAIATRLGWDGGRLDILRLGGTLHDVGKLAVAEELLRKPGPLTAHERAEIRKHPRAGAAIVWSMTSLRAAILGVLFHHECWDGSGYPTGRGGKGIPAEARILAVADSFDAMTSDRPYRPALAEEDAVAEIERCAGRQFDPDVARAFVEAWESGTFAAAPSLAAAL